MWFNLIVFWFSVHCGDVGRGFGFVYLHYDLSVLGEDDVLQRVLHQQGEVHLIHGHVRQCRLLKRGRDKNCYLPPAH